MPTEGEGDEIESILTFKIFSTLPFKKDIKQTDMPKTGGVLCLEGARGTILKDGSSPCSNTFRRP